MKIALAQINMNWEDKGKNKEKCLAFITKAKQEKVEFIVFPEMTLTGFSMNVNILGETKHETLLWFKKQAKIYEIYIGFGYIEKSVKGKNIFSIVTSEGKEIVNYTKIHPFSYGEEATYYEGGNEIFFASIHGFCVSPFICYDLRFPEIFQIASKKSELIVIIANWPASRRDHWITLLKARAIENQCYIVGVNRVGKDISLSYSGDSMIFDPLGNIVHPTSFEYIEKISAFQNLNTEYPSYQKECLLISALFLKEVTTLRGSFQIKKDRKESLYSSQYLSTKNK